MTCGTRLTLLKRLNQGIRAVAMRARESGKIQVRDSVPVIAVGNGTELDNDAYAGRDVLLAVGLP
jgi:hypothetical protein